ncbi:heterokaryon incompatibility protein-domain-containing protein [Lophiotrema nucula]|uniref:Heterokaryon incompatibility protein-domain-containing protein n=1 Tax=Lophiotrema nucula TaxID=690887 RepID=A0A6A5YI09_9PLEO|nr:heterokaryon incompatibility protein-domain-containing protein [Lophiotrema nucula]
MKLIDTTSLAIRDFLGTTTGIQYAILSHTWGDDGDEVTYQEMMAADRSATANKPGYHKILQVCEMAKKEPYELQYAWVDTCCIDKTSSAELTESINSMFRYYKEAAVCFAHLADWDLITGSSAFNTSRWFKRGWTLQELVAPVPEKLVFLDKHWKKAGTKFELAADLAKATGIDVRALDGTKPLHEFPVAVRMSWAAHRETRRNEDRAYSLLGIFDISMPMLYGEGSNAFQRLQAEIITHSTDMSIFAWRTASNSQKWNLEKGLSVNRN